MLNRTLDNRYTVLEHIGGGGMAEVYRAHDNLLDRAVALKVLRTQFTNDDEFVTRFRREAKAAAGLSHPNIVNIYDVGRDEDIYYIVMEYISGETLKDKIVREAPIGTNEAVNIIIEIAEALEHAHQNNLVHCDIKPHNILITRSGRVKVTDFGIARAVTSTTMTQTGTILGSVHYFSPEQARGSVIDLKSDIYSLGIVLYEMVTGTLPFIGESPIAIALKHLQQEPKLPRIINSEIPPLLEAVMLKALAKNPADRYDSTREMISDLRLVINYIHDDHTRRLTREDYPTQVLPTIKLPGDEEDVALNQADSGSAKTNPANKILVIGLIMLLGIGFMLGAFFTFGKFWSMKEVTVPNVIGKHINVASSMMEAQRLKVSISESYNDKVAVGLVVSQYPEPGSIVKEERIVKLIVSKGFEKVLIPDLRGINRREAEIQIKNLGLVVGKIEEKFSATVLQDVIISQSYNPAVEVPKGTPIDFVVSKGQEPKKFKLPDFRGNSLETVKKQLEVLKLKIGLIREEAGDQYPAGTVIGHNPPPGTEILEGSAIDLTTVKYVAGDVKRAVVQINVPDGPARQTIQIVVTDMNSRRIAYQGIHKIGEIVEKTVEGVGNVRIQVYINGTLVQEQTL